MASLIDTNILVYRFDAGAPDKQRIAEKILREGISRGEIRVAHQAIPEFFNAMKRRIDKGTPVLTLDEARLESNRLIEQFEILYPNVHILRAALELQQRYQIRIFDAHMLAYAQVYEIPELLSEDLQERRQYGPVRVINPFHPLRAALA